MKTYYDPKCEELARFFLKEAGRLREDEGAMASDPFREAQERNVQAMARKIQRTCEDFLAK